LQQSRPIATSARWKRLVRGPRQLKLGAARTGRPPRRDGSSDFSAFPADVRRDLQFPASHRTA
jgi:hypothetical protein